MVDKNFGNRRIAVSNLIASRKLVNPYRRKDVGCTQEVAPRSCIREPKQGYQSPINKVFGKRSVAPLQ